MTGAATTAAKIAGPAKTTPATAAKPPKNPLKPLLDSCRYLSLLYYALSRLFSCYYR
jgi:hypothetical protein